MAGKQQLNVLVDYDLYTALREFAIRCDLSMVAIVHAALTAYLAAKADDVTAESTTAA